MQVTKFTLTILIMSNWSSLVMRGTIRSSITSLSQNLILYTNAICVYRYKLDITDRKNTCKR